MARILIVEDSPDTLNLIRIKLTKAGHEVIPATDGESALHLAFRHNPSLVVLDVMLPKIDGYDVAKRLRQTPLTSHVGILMLTSRAQIADKVSGFESGADDYLTKPFDPAELELRVRTLLARTAPVVTSPSAGPQGKLISVFSLRGGVGKTTLAVNLAVTMAQLWKMTVPLLDLALQEGHASLFLGLRPKATLDGLVEHWKEYPDADSLAELFTKKDQWVRVLAAPRHPAGAERVSAEMLKHLTKIMRFGSPLTIADLSGRLDDPMLAVLDASDRILLVLAPEVASVHTTVETLDTFNALDYALEKVRIVVNYLFARRALSPAQIESAVNMPVALALPFEPEAFVHAVNTGEAYVSLNPHSAATHVLQDFAYQLGLGLALPDAEVTPLAKSVQARLTLK